VLTCTQGAQTRGVGFGTQFTPELVVPVTDELTVEVGVVEHVVPSWWW
jgi:hypothetical protein